MTSTAWYAHTDAGLLDRAEQGDEAAFTALYRRYYGSTRRLAYTYLLRGEPDDLVDATFAEVVDALRSQRRPTDSFGLHLFATLRRLAGQRPEAAPPGVVGEVPPAVVAVAGRQALGGTDRATITQAFSSLSERWQVIVWHLAIDRCDATELSYRLGVGFAAAAVQAHRAGTKLRQAFLDAHLRAAPRPGCHPHRDRLAALHRGALGPSATAATSDHLDRCDSCRNLVADFDHLEERLAWAVAPLFPVVAMPGVTAAPLAVGRAGQEVATQAHDTGPLPFRSASGSPRHMATSGRGPGTGSALARRPPPRDEPPEPYAEPDDTERRRPAFGALGAAVAAVLLLVGGVAVATTALSGGRGNDVDIAAAGDVQSTGGLPADRDETDTERAAVASPSTAGQASTTASTSDDGTTTSSRSRSSTSSSSSSSSSSSTTGQATTSSTAPAATVPGTPTTPTPLVPAPRLVLDAPAWQLTPEGTGLLTVGVSRPAANVAAMEPPSDTAVELTIDVTDGVRLAATLDPRCDANTTSRGTIRGVITCDLEPPAPGAAEALSVALVVVDGGQYAEVSAEQDGDGLGTATTDLDADPVLPLTTTTIPASG